jgi:hypothetical protein
MRAPACESACLMWSEAGRVQCRVAHTHASGAGSRHMSWQLDSGVMCCSSGATATSQQHAWIQLLLALLQGATASRARGGAKPGTASCSLRVLQCAPTWQASGTSSVRNRQ